MAAIAPRRPPGGRRHPRPQHLEPCRQCGAPTGMTYPTCPGCYDAVERYWRADWAALLDAEGIIPGSDDELLLARVVVAELDRHPWTLVDVAMSLARCGSCGEELAGGPKECQECATAFGNLWAYDVEAQYDGTMTGNEHALRVGRWVLRYPHRQSANAVAGWRESVPLLLTGALPSTRWAQATAARIRAGKRGRG